MNNGLSIGYLNLCSSIIHSRYFSVITSYSIHYTKLYDHPTTGEEMLFDSDLAADMVDAINKWRDYISNRSVEE